MSTLALTISRQQTRTIQRTHPVLAVMGWELRRFRASRFFWLQILGLFCFLILLTWAEATREGVVEGKPVGFIAGTSAWGLAHTLPTTLTLLVLFLPFITADGVTRDVRRRTHELLMTTALPGWAYVWGRYLVDLLMSLGLALVLLAAIEGTGTVLHLTTDYPAPILGNILLLWAVMVVPATVLVSSLGFAAATLLPRLSTMVKIVLLLGWVVGAEVIPSLLYAPSGPDNLPPTGYSAWDPTGALTSVRMLQQYSPTFEQQVSAATTPAQIQHLINTIANQTPDVSALLAPHLVEALLSFALVALAAFTFRRFRNAFGA